MVSRMPVIPYLHYDANGNMTYHPGKGATIIYNHLNLPRKVDFGNDKIIEWTYDAEGSILLKETKKGAVVLESRHYLGSTEYRNGEIVQINHDRGRLVRDKWL